MPVKTVVELDLVGYNAISGVLEDSIDAGTVAQINQQIQGFVDAGLRAVGAERNRTVMQTTGDGAILIFDRSAEAHGFAAAVHEATRNHNRGRNRSIGKRVFRVGVATGEIHICSKPDGGHDIAGTVIARAVRLEANASPGGVLIDEDTFAGLTPDQQRNYVGPERVTGKRNETFDVWRCVLNPEGEKDVAEFLRGVPPRDPRADDAPDEQLLDNLLRELLRPGRVAEAPTNLEHALRAGFGGVEQSLRGIDATAEFDLDDVLAVVHEAIRHGAGIYNHSPAGRVICGRIYHRAAVGLAAKVPAPRHTSGNIPTGAYLAIDWLNRIVKAVPEVTPENGDDLAWELRFAFDAAQLVPMCDSVTTAVGAAASSTDDATLCGLLRRVVEASRDLQPLHVRAYLLQHTARVLLQHLDAGHFTAGVLRHSRQPLREILADQSRVTRQNTERLVQRSGQCFVRICQNIETNETAPERPRSWWWPFGS